MSNKVLASYDLLMDIAENHIGVAFYWENDEKGMEPLWIDPTTANLMVKVHNAINNKNQIQFVEWVAASRWQFGSLVDFSWSRVQKK